MAYGRHCPHHPQARCLRHQRRHRKSRLNPTPVAEGFRIFESEEFGQVRVVVGPDGEPWFVASDVAAVLGYTNPQKAVRDHCKYPKTLKQNDSFSLTDSPRGLTIIPESDVYRLIMRSKMPQAEEVQDWVTSDILPSIRKHGVYATHDFVEQALADPSTMIRTLEALQEERRGRTGNSGLSRLMWRKCWGITTMIRPSESTVNMHKK